MVPDTDLHIGSLGGGYKGQTWSWALALQIIGGGWRNVTADPSVNQSVNGNTNSSPPRSRSPSDTTSEAESRFHLKRERARAPLLRHFKNRSGCGRLWVRRRHRGRRLVQAQAGFGVSSDEMPCLPANCVTAAWRSRLLR